MTSTKPSEIRDMTPQERAERIVELKEELMRERGMAAMGGAPTSPGKIRALRRNISRYITIMKEEGEA
ncbi:MAG: 50S ribosomal protein L29 [Thermoplasmata archaeon]|nr:50S ribosomal protein L29 [Thermoplasmata archaeon]MCK5413985.1 50S ribosomal protein L29 [Thermoplasmata archaeon]